MSTLLAYSYAPGYHEVFRETTSILMDDPLEGRQAGRLILRVEYVFHDDSPHGGWVLQCNKTLVEKSGPLAEFAPPEKLQDRAFLFRITPDGMPYDIGGGLPPRRPIFPQVPVQVGDWWNNQDELSRDGQPPMILTYNFVLLEERKGDLQADLVVAGDTVKDGVRTEVEGTVTFSVTHGKVTYSITKIEMTWPSITPESEKPQRRVVKTVIESELWPDHGAEEKAKVEKSEGSEAAA